MRSTNQGAHLGLSQIIEGNPVATIVIDGQHRVTHWNRACAVLTGVAAAEMIGKSEQWRAFYQQPRPIMADLIVDGALAGDVQQFYQGKFRPSVLIDGAFEAEDFFQAFGPDGRWLFFTAAAIRDENGKIIGAIETLQDVTERRRAEAALSDNEAFLKQVVDGSSVATLVLDSEHRVSHWNHACEVITGTLAADVVGTRDQWRAFYPARRPIMADLILDGAEEGSVDRLYHGRYRASVLVQGGFEAEDFFPHFGDGGRWLFFTAAPLRNAAGQVIGAIETLQDVTERRRAEEALKTSEERYRLLSVTDSLTGLFNSRHLHERLPDELERAQRYLRPLSLLVLDADHFKRINDTFGHLEGDKVLQALARVIRQCLRRADSAFRYGGEEFVVLLPEAGLAAGRALAERLCHSFAEQQVVDQEGRVIRCTVSIGVAEYLTGETPNQLIRRADDATYEAKRRGRNCVVVSAPNVAADCPTV